MNGYSPVVMYTVNSFNNMSDVSNRVEESSSVYSIGLGRSSHFQGLWNIIEDRNSSTDFLQSSVIERQGATMTANIGYDLDSFLIFSNTPSLTPEPLRYKKISLGEARRHAIMVLENAEKRREAERESEAKFWESLDKYDL